MCSNWLIIFLTLLFVFIFLFQLFHPFIIACYIRGTLFILSDNGTLITSSSLAFFFFVFFYLLYIWFLSTPFLSNILVITFSFTFTIYLVCLSLLFFIFVTIVHASLTTISSFYSSSITYFLPPSSSFFRTPIDLPDCFIWHLSKCYHLHCTISRLF